MYVCIFNAYHACTYMLLVVQPHICLVCSYIEIMEIQQSQSDFVAFTKYLATISLQVNTNIIRRY